MQPIASPKAPPYQRAENTQQVLNELALFDITGPDAASFLQGQLTQDMLTWQPHEIKRAAWCNAKGRMLATFYIWQISRPASDSSIQTIGFRCLMARDLTAKLLPRLRMFVLRAKVNISAPLERALYAARSTGSALTHADEVMCLLDSGFAVSNKPDLSCAHMAEQPQPNWLCAHIASGVVWISAINTEQFVPQTTNFELVGGVNFRKGCYPGQEIVARSQYLGKLKLRAAIAQVPAQCPALQDIFTTDSPNPVGRVIQTDQGLALIEAPHALIEAQALLRLGSGAGDLINLLPLPYPILDITA